MQNASVNPFAVERAVWKSEAGIFLSVTGHRNNVSLVCEDGTSQSSTPISVYSQFK